MQHWTDRLSEYLDDTLTASERRDAEEHLAGCADCASTLVDLRTIVERARTLESRPPEIDLWPAIAARLTPRRLGLGSRIRGWLGTRRYSFSFPQLAAATAAIALVTAGLVWMGLQRAPDQVAMMRSSPTQRVQASGPQPDTTPGDRSVMARPRTSFPSTHGTAVEGTSFASFDGTRYDAAVAELQQVLHDHRADLDTSTVRILEQNLAIIDRALDEARSALENDPSNPYLNGHLAEQMLRKVRLLQKAADVVTAHS